MSDNNPPLTRFALDWDRIAADIQSDLEREMDAAFEVRDGDRYRRAGLIAGKVKTARRVMLDSRSMATSMANQPSERDTTRFEDDAGHRPERAPGSPA